MKNLYNQHRTKKKEKKQWKARGEERKIINSSSVESQGLSLNHLPEISRSQGRENGFIKVLGRKKKLADMYEILQSHLV